ncbi:hypothetical protein BV25DRAFT_1822040, partial [Artomyces pyxidatus]
MTFKRGVIVVAVVASLAAFPAACSLAASFVTFCEGFIDILRLIVERSFLPLVVAAIFLCFTVVVFYYRGLAKQLADAKRRNIVQTNELIRLRDTRTADSHLLSAANLSIKSLRQDLQSVRDESFRADKELSALVWEKQTLSHRSQEHANIIKKLTAKVEEAERVNASHSEVLQSAHAVSRLLEQEKFDQACEIDKLKDTVASLGSEFAATQSSLRKQLEESRDRERDARRAGDAREAQLVESRSTERAAQHEYTRLSALLADLRLSANVQAAASDALIADLRAKLAEKDDELKSMRSMTAAGEDRVAASDATLLQVRAELVAALRSARLSSEQQSTDAQLLQTKDRAISDLQAQLQDLSNKLVASEDEIVRLRSELRWEALRRTTEIQQLEVARMEAEKRAEEKVEEVEALLREEQEFYESAEWALDTIHTDAKAMVEELGVSPNFQVTPLRPRSPDMTLDEMGSVYYPEQHSPPPSDDILMIESHPAALSPLPPDTNIHPDIPRIRSPILSLVKVDSNKSLVKDVFSSSRDTSALQQGAYTISSPHIGQRVDTTSLALPPFSLGRSVFLDSLASSKTAIASPRLFSDVAPIFSTSTPFSGLPAFELGKSILLDGLRSSKTPLRRSESSSGSRMSAIQGSLTENLPEQPIDLESPGVSDQLIIEELGDFVLLAQTSLAITQTALVAVHRLQSPPAPKHAPELLAELASVQQELEESEKTVRSLRASAWEAARQAEAARLKQEHLETIAIRFSNRAKRLESAVTKLSGHLDDAMEARDAFREDFILAASYLQERNERIQALTEEIDALDIRCSQAHLRATSLEDYVQLLQSKFEDASKVEPMSETQTLTSPAQCAGDIRLSDHVTSHYAAPEDQSSVDLSFILFNNPMPCLIDVSLSSVMNISFPLSSSGDVPGRAVHDDDNALEEENEVMDIQCSHSSLLPAWLLHPHLQDRGEALEIQSLAAGIGVETSGASTASAIVADIRPIEESQQTTVSDTSTPLPDLRIDAFKAFSQMSQTTNHSSQSLLSEHSVIDNLSGLESSDFFNVSAFSGEELLPSLRTDMTDGSEDDVDASQSIQHSSEIFLFGINDLSGTGSSDSLVMFSQACPSERFLFDIALPSTSSLVSISCFDALTGTDADCARTSRSMHSTLDRRPCDDEVASSSKHLSLEQSGRLSSQFLPLVLVTEVNNSLLGDPEPEWADAVYRLLPPPSSTSVACLADTPFEPSDNSLNAELLSVPITPGCPQLPSPDVATTASLLSSPMAVRGFNINGMTTTESMLSSSFQEVRKLRWDGGPRLDRLRRGGLFDEQPSSCWSLCCAQPPRSYPTR